jgi:hypothetical protein
MWEELVKWFNISPVNNVSEQLALGVFNFEFCEAEKEFWINVIWENGHK